MPLDLLAIAALLGGAPLAAQAVPQSVSASPEIRLDRTDDPVALERQLRALLRRDAAAALTVAGGLARAGGFALGTLDTLRGHLLVLMGNADIHGRLDGNVVTLDGDVVVHPGGRVTGDALALGGRVRNAGVIGGVVRAHGRSSGLSRFTIGPLGFAERTLGLLGVFLALTTIGFGLVTFGRPALEVVSDTVAHSLGRSFLVGLLAEILAIPTGALAVAGLALTVVGIVLIPFAVAAYLLLAVTCLVLGTLAAAHAMGEAWSRRRMARGVVLSPNSYRYVGTGLVGLAVVWAVWALFGWVPVAGPVILAAAALTTWLLVTLGLGGTILSRVGARQDFAGRLLPPEALTDEYLWVTPQVGVPAMGKSEGRRSKVE